MKTGTLPYSKIQIVSEDHREEERAIRRKIVLKEQALKVIRAEREDLKRRLFLLGLKEFYEKQMTDCFDPVLSRKIDCVIYLLESREGRPDGV